MKLYPIVSILVIIHFTYWFLHFLGLPIATEIYLYGVGSNLHVSLGEYWRLLTSIFLHLDLTHALFNSFSLVIFGPALERMLGKIRFLFVYFGAGIIGNIATFYLEPLRYTHLGASGAIYGLLGVYIFMIIFRKHLMDHGSSQIVKTILIFGVLMSLIGRKINIVAHFGGFAGGFLLAPLVLRNVRPFSTWITYRRRYPSDGGEISFDPNRWQKKRRIPEIIRKNWLWIIIGILALIGLLSRFN